jgi:hypothetical protein
MELELEYFNSAVMKKLDVMVQDGVGPILFRMLDDRLGDKFQATYEKWHGDSLKTRNQRAPIKWVNGRPDWDFNGIMHGIVFYAERYPNTKNAKEEAAVADKLRRLRNDISHANIDDIGARASIERTFEFLRAVQKLFEDFGASAQSRDVRSMISSYDKYLKDMRSRGATSEPNSFQYREQDVGRTSAEAGSKTPNTDPKAKDAEASAEKADGFKAKPDVQSEQGPKLPTRTTDLPEPGPGHVWFPIIGEGVDEYAYFRVSKNKETQPHVLANAPGMDESRKRALLQVIDAVRHDEQDDSLSSSTTRFRFGGEFIGPSFGVAAAFADRSARYGISSQIKDTIIVATGAVFPNKRGEVGQINGLLEKMRFIETSPDSQKAGKLLFIFPQANLVSVEPEVREILTRWKSEVSRIQWRAIAHIDELNDLLGTGQAKPGTVPEPKPTDVVVDNTEQAGSAEAAADQSNNENVDIEISVAKPRRFGRWLTTGVAAGLLVAAVISGLSVWIAKSRIDPAVLQASDNRITMLATAAEAARATIGNPDFCNKVGSAADSLTDFDKQRLTQDATNAIAYWQSCHDKFAASDGRRSELVRLAVNAKSGNGDLAALAQATGQITAFDLSRDQTSAIQAALATGKEAVAAVDASRNRLADFSAAWVQFQEDRQKFDNQLQTAMNKITPQDEKLADSGEASAIKVARQYFTDRQQSANRIAALKSAAKQYQAAPSYKTAKAFVSAYDQMGSEDQTTLLSSLSDLPPDAGIADARQRLDASTARLNAVSRLYETVSADEPRGSLRYSSLLELQDAASSITDFDKSGMTDKHYAAMKKATQISGILAASDQRISQALGNAMNAKLRDYKVTTALYNSIQSSVSLLQALDIDRIGLDEKMMIVTACNAAPAPAPGTVAPEINLRCGKL